MKKQGRRAFLKKRTKKLFSFAGNTAASQVARRLRPSSP
jgi:hypothetical protein